jgi:hypothetical protein
MRIEVDIKPMDIFVGQFFMIPRQKINYIIYLMFVILGFMCAVTDVGLLGALISAPLLGFLGFAGMYLAGLIFQAPLFLSKEMGLIGPRVFEILEGGLFEKSNKAELLSYWCGVREVYKSRHSIYIKLNGWMFHVIPKHAFASLADYDAFYLGIKSRVDAGRA